MFLDSSRAGTYEKSHHGSSDVAGRALLKRTIKLGHVLSALPQERLWTGKIMLEARIPAREEWCESTTTLTASRLQRSSRI